MWEEDTVVENLKTEILAQERTANSLKRIAGRAFSTMTILRICIATMAAVSLGAASGRFEFVNKTGKDVQVFTKRGGGVENFRLRSDERHSIRVESIEWGWRFSEATGEVNTDGTTPCSARVEDDQEQTLEISTGDKCYID